MNPVWWLAAWAGSAFVSCGVVGWVSYWAGFDRGADDEQGRHRAGRERSSEVRSPLGMVAGRLAIEPPLPGHPEEAGRILEWAASGFPVAWDGVPQASGPAEYALLTGRYVMRPDPNAGLLAALADLDAVVAEARELERQWAP